MGRFVILSGPSCVGKGPLHQALKRLYPELANKLKPLVLYNSRSPRPSEEDGIDYHFRSRDEIQSLRTQDQFAVFEVRGDLQALDLKELQKDLSAGDVFFEGNPFIGAFLLDCQIAARIEKLTVFLSPLSRREVLYLRKRVNLQAFLADMMRRKLLRRLTAQKQIPSLPDLEDVERRAKSAYQELRKAHLFQHVIPNHDGEDSENWSAFYYPVADAFKALESFAGLLEGKKPDEHVEHWEEDLLS